MFILKLNVNKVNKFKAKKNSKRLIKALRNEDYRVRGAAAKAIGELKDPIAVEPLIAALDDRDYSVREYVVEALGLIRDEKAIEYLIPYLADEIDSVVKCAVKALDNISLYWRSNEGLEGLKKALQNEDYRVRGAAAKALGESKNSIAVEPLVAALDDRKYSVREYVFEALGLIRDESAIEYLIPYLADETDSVVKCAVKALDNISLNWRSNEGSLRAISKLILELNDAYNKIHEYEKAGIISISKSESDRRSKLVTALGIINDPIAIEALINSIKNDWDDVACIAIEALSRYGEITVDPLIKLISSNNTKFRRRSSVALGLLGQPALEPLIYTFHNNDPDVKIAAAFSLCKLDYIPRSEEEKIWISTASQQWEIVFKSGNLAIEPLCALLNFLDIKKYPEEIKEIINFIGKALNPKAINSLIKFINENGPTMLREFTIRDSLKCLAAKVLKKLNANVTFTFRPYCFLCFTYMDTISFPSMGQQTGDIECKGCNEKYSCWIEEHDDNISMTIERFLIPTNNTKAISNFYSPSNATLEK